MTSSRTSFLSSLVLAAALLAACGGDDDAATTDTSSEPTVEETTTSSTAETAADEAASGDDLVIMEESRFVPQALEVGTGTEVTFENTDPYAHTVTSAEGSPLEFDSGELGQDETFRQTFDEAGTYDYFCEIHPTMRAEIVVS